MTVGNNRNVPRGLARLHEHLTPPPPRSKVNIRSPSQGSRKTIGSQVPEIRLQNIVERFEEIGA
jgi:hypothetical protein